MLLHSSVYATKEYPEGNMNNQQDGSKGETANGLSVVGKITQG